MAEINDFGFTAVDQDELKTKTGEDASIGKEVADQLKAVAASNVGQANSAQLWLENVNFDQLLLCIAALENKGIKIEQLNVSAVEQPGLVRAKLKVSRS